MVTLIQGGWVVGFDGQTHTLIRDGVVVYNGDQISHVGARYNGAVDERIDARGMLVMPGLVNCHVHAAVDTQIMWLDAGRRDFFGSIGLSGAAGKGRAGERPHLTPEQQRDGTRFAVAQVLRSGVTTFIESGVSIGNPEVFSEIAAEFGARVYVACGYQSATWHHDPERNGALGYDWDEAAGMAGLARARAFVEQFDGSQEGRIRGMLMPAQIDTCSPDLLRETAAVAADTGVNVQIHAAQYLYEFHEMLRRHRRTPIEHLADVGLLGPHTSVAHCLFTTTHPMTHLPAAEPGDRADGDLALLARTGTSVAHCALVFARRGLAMHSFDGYRRAGVNMALGTDTFARDLIQEMRIAALACKLTEGNFLAGNARDLFNAATLGGARLLGRNDIGRLAPGAKADVAVVDFRDLHVGPVNDPIRTLIHAATGANVDRVIIDGRTVVAGKRIVDLDEAALLARVQPINDELRRTLPLRDWQGRTPDELFPPTFPVVG